MFLHRNLCIRFFFPIKKDKKSNLKFVMTQISAGSLFRRKQRTHAHTNSITKNKKSTKIDP